jgi:hypothetical protein
VSTIAIFAAGTFAGAATGAGCVTAGLTGVGCGAAGLVGVGVAAGRACAKVDTFATIEITIAAAITIILLIFV